MLFVLDPSGNQPLAFGITLFVVAAVLRLAGKTGVLRVHISTRRGALTASVSAGVIGIVVAAVIHQVM